MSQQNGFDIIAKAISDIETVGIDKIPSLNHILEGKGFYVTPEDIRALRQWLKERKYKLVRVTDYAIVRRRRRK